MPRRRRLHLLDDRPLDELLRSEQTDLEDEPPHVDSQEPIHPWNPGNVHDYVGGDGSHDEEGDYEPSLLDESPASEPEAYPSWIRDAIDKAESDNESMQALPGPADPDLPEPSGMPPEPVVPSEPEAIASPASRSGSSEPEQIVPPGPWPGPSEPEPDVLPGPGPGPSEPEPIFPHGPGPSEPDPPEFSGSRRRLPREGADPVRIEEVSVAFSSGDIRYNIMSRQIRAHCKCVGHVDCILTRTSKPAARPSDIYMQDKGDP
jgi:hypothetical protein